MRHLFIIMIGIAYSSLPAFAQPQSNLSYTSAGHKAEKSGGTLHYLAIPRPEDQNAQENTSTEKEKGISEDVWKKYKALAAGKEHKQNAPTKPEKPTTETIKAQQTTTQAPAKKTTGFAAIIEKYQSNKEQQKTLHTLTISRPKSPTVPAPQPLSVDKTQ